MKAMSTISFIMPLQLCLLVLSLVFLSSCGGGQSKESTSSKSDSATTHRSPSATEVFHLRSECAKCTSELIKAEKLYGANVVSHYDPKGNRCYAEANITGDKSNPLYVADYLYDAQTHEMLAMAIYYNDKHQTGLIFKIYPEVNAQKYTSRFSYESAKDYIEDMMSDE